MIISLFTDEKQKFEYHRPMKAIAIDPDYARKASRRFVTGGLAGNLYFNTKKWLGYRDQVFFHAFLYGILFIFTKKIKQIHHFV